MDLMNEELYPRFRMGSIGILQSIKSNEIKAIPALLKVLDLKGCIIRIDAIGCRKEIAKTAVARKADDILALGVSLGPPA